MKHTPFLEKHQECGARLVDFAGWQMPVQYAGLVQEHKAVREAVGLFDVSHMGEIDVKGPDAVPFLQNLLTNNVKRCAVGQAQYNVMLLESGGIVDDLVIYRRADDHYMLCVNASNSDKDFAWVAKNVGDFDVSVTNVSEDWAQLAIQGPKATATLQKLTDADLNAFGTYRFVEADLAGVPMIISRTGYTGEPGFEIFFSPSHAAKVWDGILGAGEEFGLQPIGLGARDTLRLEMKYALYGNDIDETTLPLEAGLGWIVRLRKPQFIGKAALVAAKEAGLKRKLIGFELKGRGIARHGYAIVDAEGKSIGEVTSGTHSPSLGKSIGMAYVPIALAEVGTPLKIQIRKKVVDAQVVETPFYSK